MCIRREKRVFSAVQYLFRWYFYIKRLAGFEKKQLKFYLNWKSYLPCFISSSSSQMKTPIGNGNPCNILHVVFSSFYLIILFLKGWQGKWSYTALLCYVCHHNFYRIYLNLGRESLFNNANLCKSNVVQISEFFCDSER